MPKKIILIRHGETDYNKERRIQGWLNIPLNEIGHSQAKAAAELVKDYPVDALYSSDLLRAHETAIHLAKILRTEIMLSNSLRERDMGIFAGWAFEKEPDPEKERLWVEFEKARDSNMLDWKKHQGESIGDMAARLVDFFESIHQIHKDQTVVIVSHGGTINRILEHFGVKDAKEGYRTVNNASVLVLHKESTVYRLEEL